MKQGGRKKARGRLRHKEKKGGKRERGRGREGGLRERASEIERAVNPAMLKNDPLRKFRNFICGSISFVFFYTAIENNRIVTR